MLKKLVSYGLISVMSLGMLAACGTSDDDSAEPTVTRAATSNAPAIATATAEGASGAATAQVDGGTAAEGDGGETAPPAGSTEIELSAVDIAYDQTELAGPADTDITITITNNGAAQHDFVIDELGIATKLLNPGESETVTINAPAGEYTYYCSVPGHRQAGMEGTLTLSADAGAAAPAGDEEAATEGEAASSPAAEETTAEQPAGAETAGGDTALELSAVDIAWDQTELSGPADTQFTITITNNGLAQHDFVIDELGITTKMLNPGESETVTINAPAGEYTYYCSVPGHRQAGMEGTLTLSADTGAAAAPAGDEEAAATESTPAPATDSEAAAASPAAADATPDEGGAAAPAGDQAAAGAPALELSAVDIAYDQTELSGPADTAFTITITNNGLAQHDFVIDELGIATKLLNPGESETVTINAPAGEYTYYCSVPGHRAAGMEGTLTLSADAGAAAPAGEEAVAEASPAASPAASPVASPEAAGGAALELSAVDIAFDQTELSGPADTEFTITITNNGLAQHDFVIDELGIKTKMLNPGESETVTINAPAGEYIYYCSVPGHRPAGMEGTLTLQ